jgi:hypothetical protein
VILCMWHDKESKEEKTKAKPNDHLEARQKRARAALVARLPGGAFREFLVQNVPGYSSLEGLDFNKFSIL